MNNLKTNFLMILSALLMVSCEYEEHFRYTVYNESDQPIGISFAITGEGYNAYENSDLDTLLAAMESITIYEESGGLISGSENASDHRTIYWDMDSLIITLNDSTHFQKFSNPEYWSFSSDDANGEYELVINKSNTH